ncbi:MAG: hypothetical protein EOS54_12410 [Mesorhizobium sp.]|uniref:hypothetical protein n=1 Tax=unclassified Mesorhizobium TaxID=325217 RepID=UPI000F7575E5|nr:MULTISPECIES: hypothetical protein [unclassified Mesorhizobium]AZO47229.1 hypothetical protein EJ073_04840 [Mesorhizobium sp. M4B.F.Ca.ET.058.02.1.1]RWC53515.1 MAG: hypothetical protein EOS54_12410 [Mesorhizobium sp.]RWD13966.1 MAG: hypothetical protein EOS74_18420 [Mesorhizobium sp.]RWD55679.1 MAG: hypothetical protein EOS75_17145 [Mesorhizobium sp.]TIW13893.1 MAG: hypothetical protein E5V66_01925 [Mesorhizobium sp.]
MVGQLLGTTPIRPGLEKAYDAAVLFEARNPACTLQEVAQHLLDEEVLPDWCASGWAAEAAVAEWRSFWHYLANIVQYRSWMAH